MNSRVKSLHSPCSHSMVQRNLFAVSSTSSLVLEGVYKQWEAISREDALLLKLSVVTVNVTSEREKCLSQMLKPKALH